MTGEPEIRTPPQFCGYQINGDPKIPGTAPTRSGKRAHPPTYPSRSNRKLCNGARNESLAPAVDGARTRRTLERQSSSLRGLQRQTLNPQPSNLNPEHPHPQPSTPNPQLSTLHPKHPHPKSSTLNPERPNPKTPTIDPEHSNLNPPSSTRRHSLQPRGGQAQASVSEGNLLFPSLLRHAFCLCSVSLGFICLQQTARWYERSRDFIGTSIHDATI